MNELGYFDGAENNLGGWEANRFVRSSNLIPTEWIIWQVKSSNPIQIERIALTTDRPLNLKSLALVRDLAVLC